VASNTGRGISPGGERTLAVPRSRRGDHQGAVRILTGLSVVAIVGPPNAGDLIAKAALAIEMGADAEDMD
jgi:pyruvate/2-oxoglutarate dehydrogenase complex dihydrolipoamide dehydrogenase (E3) component